MTETARTPQTNPTKFYDPHHNGYDIGKRFLEDQTMSPEDWRDFVISGEIVIFRDRLAELLELESMVKGRSDGF